MKRSADAMAAYRADMPGFRIESGKTEGVTAAAPYHGLIPRRATARVTPTNPQMAACRPCISGFRIERLFSQTHGRVLFANANNWSGKTEGADPRARAGRA